MKKFMIISSLIAIFTFLSFIEVNAHEKLESFEITRYYELGSSKEAFDIKELEETVAKKRIDDFPINIEPQPEPSTMSMPCIGEACQEEDGGSTCPENTTLIQGYCRLWRVIEETSSSNFGINTTTCNTQYITHCESTVTQSKNSENNSVLVEFSMNVILNPQDFKDVKVEAIATYYGTPHDPVKDYLVVFTDEYLRIDYSKPIKASEEVTFLYQEFNTITGQVIDSGYGTRYYSQTHPNNEIILPNTGDDGSGVLWENGNVYSSYNLPDWGSARISGGVNGNGFYDDVDVIKYVQKVEFTLLHDSLEPFYGNRTTLNFHAEFHHAYEWYNISFSNTSWIYTLDWKAALFSLQQTRHVGVSNVRKLDISIKLY